MNRIILVTDDKEILDAIPETLKRNGHEVDVHRHGADTLLAFYQWPSRFDLAIVDQDMEDISGSALARKLLRLSPRIPIILLVKKGDMDAKLEGRIAGIRCFVCKPISAEDIINAVEEALRH